MRAGEPSNIKVQTRPGFALMGGGTDLDEAFKFLCDRASGGDFLVLRATGDDEYNPYVRGLCHLNSVATLIIPNREAAADPFVRDAIMNSSAIFIAGGDQANYINFWMNTPVQTALNDAIHRGVPIGGTSAGLAVMGEYVYTAQGDKPDDPNLDGKTALSDPYSSRIRLAQDFLLIPILKNIVTDTHFARRDRMGRLLVFLARFNEADERPATHGKPLIRGVGVDERAALLLEPDGKAHVVGYGAAYFIDADHGSGSLQKGKPLTYGPFTVQKVAPGADFYIKSWAGDGITYRLSVEAGKLHSTQTANEVY
jgi:cyanophycinase